MGRGEFYRNKYGGGRGRGRGDRERDGGGGWRSSPAGAGAAAGASAPAATWAQLGGVLRDIHGRNYGAYHELERRFAFSGEEEGDADALRFSLGFDRVQSDPYASPSRAHVLVDAASAALPAQLFRDKTRNVALCDFLTRQFAAAATRAGADAKTSSSSWHGAKGGDISIDAPGQHVIERSSVMVLDSGAVEARFNINLPARGRSICGDWAYTILVETLPRLVKSALVLRSLDVERLWDHVKSVEDQEALRGMLKSAGLVGFIRDGAILPREVQLNNPVRVLCCHSSLNFWFCCESCSRVRLTAH